MGGYRIILLSALAISAICLACAPLNRSYPDKKYFVLDIQNKPAFKAALGNTVVRVKSFKAPQQYQNKNFVYRIGEHEFATDFYNEFLAPPPRMLAEEAAAWLESSGLFKHVITQSSQLLPDFIIEGSIENLYGDFSSQKDARAVVSIKLFLIDARRARSTILIQRTYDGSHPLKDNSPEALVAGWNKGLADIFDEFARTVESLPAAVIQTNTPSRK